MLLGPAGGTPSPFRALLLSHVQRRMEFLLGDDQECSDFACSGGAEIALQGQVVRMRFVGKRLAFFDVRDTSQGNTEILQLCISHKDLESFEDCSLPPFPKPSTSGRLVESNEADIMSSLRHTYFRQRDAKTVTALFPGASAALDCASCKKRNKIEHQEGKSRAGCRDCVSPALMDRLKRTVRLGDIVQVYGFVSSQENNQHRLHTTKSLACAVDKGQRVSCAPPSKQPPKENDKVRVVREGVSQDEAELLFCRASRITVSVHVTRMKRKHSWVHLQQQKKPMDHRFSLSHPQTKESLNEDQKGRQEVLDRFDEATLLMALWNDGPGKNGYTTATRPCARGKTGSVSPKGSFVCPIGSPAAQSSAPYADETKPSSSTLGSAFGTAAAPVNSPHWVRLSSVMPAEHLLHVLHHQRGKLTTAQYAKKMLELHQKDAAAQRQARICSPSTKNTRAVTETGKEGKRESAKHFGGSQGVPPKKQKTVAPITPEFFASSLPIPSCISSPLGHYSLAREAPKSKRATIFAAWLVDTFGKEHLSGGSGVLDVAGGKGLLAWELQIVHGVRCTLVDPRPSAKLTKAQRKKLRKKKVQRFGHIRALFDETLWKSVATRYTSPLQEEHKCAKRTSKKNREGEGETKAKGAEQAPLDTADVLRRCSCVVGLHPDQATDFIVEFADQFEKPFAVVPCCVFPSVFVDRKDPADGSPVVEHRQLVRYLLNKAKGCEEAQLPFNGRNTVVYRVK